MALEKSLTKAQRLFLESYFEDILFGRPQLMTLPKDKAVAMIAESDFDDAMSQPSSRVRVANNLNSLGMFKSFDVHDHGTGPFIYLEFSDLGAETLYDLLKRAEVEGRLPVVKTAEAA